MNAKFAALDGLLTAHQEYWRFSPFRYSDLNAPCLWHTKNKPLSSWLSTLPMREVTELRSEPKELRNILAGFVTDISLLTELTHLPPSNLAGLSLPRGFTNGIPGRKLDQITAMGAAALHGPEPSEWLEWCAGKGYLGRVLAQCSAKDVTSLEYQQCLCDSGQREADKLKLPMQFVHCDALSLQAKSILNDKQHAVALHACGDLHVRLMEFGVEKHIPAFTIAPCCYHLVDSESYRPLSSIGKSSTLQFTKQELRIPLQELVTGGMRVQRHRQQEMSYRLGLDAMLRTSGSNMAHITIPSIKKSLLSNGFEWFCHWAATERQLTLPSDNFDEFHEVGKARFEKMEKLTLVQDVFKRPLEMWLVYDRAQYLQEHGYRVALSTFCDRQISPRNILIQAQRTDKP
ncbi:SAM-dependent methyltransferase [Vibrio sp. S4M6]|uniref:methyltransferase n=1 Tax=Vibrio sinus TaxID=2946865 RepID=UPI00202A3F9A|nr:methyltransferase [Vibrio sinus]MCL9783032.1 SAM-dependent methyltransferase [Vibrio sinus]